MSGLLLEKILTDNGLDVIDTEEQKIISNLIKGNYIPELEWMN